MNDDMGKLRFVLGYLEGTVGSVKVYSREQLLRKMRYLVKYIKRDAPLPSKFSKTARLPKT
jgi:hypothetical protein